MLPFFPMPYPDEMLYSAFSRYHLRSRNKSHKTTMMELYGQYRKISAEWPSHLNDFCANLPPGSLHTFDRVIQRLTFLPFYRPFFETEVTDLLKSFMLNGANPARLMGIKSSLCRMGIPSWSRMHFCPTCLQEDTTKFGEPYWHRVHQLPGILACPIHRVALHESSVLMTDTTSFFIPLDQMHLKDSVPIVEDGRIDERDMSVSSSAQWLLESDAESLGLRRLAERYRAHLQVKGYLSGNGRLRRETLTQAFIEFHGNDFLGRMHSQMRYVTFGKNWFDEFFWPQHTLNHPIRHILVMQFLGLTPHELFYGPIPLYKPFGEGPWPCLNRVCPDYKEAVIQTVTITEIEIGRPTGTFECRCGFIYRRRGPDTCDQDRYKIGRVFQRGQVWERHLLELDSRGLGVNEIAKRIGTTPAFVETSLNKLKAHVSALSSTDCPVSLDEETRREMRNAWLSAMAANPRMSMSVLRRMAEYISTVNWLIKHDRLWFRENAPKNFDVGNMGASRVDWHARDVRYAEEIDAICPEILAQNENPVRLTRSFIIKRLGYSFNFFKNIDKLPLTNEALNRWEETSYNYHVRRIHMAIRQLVATGEKINSSIVAKKAGLGWDQKKWITEIDHAVADAALDVHYPRDIPNDPTFTDKPQN